MGPKEKSSSRSLFIGAINLNFFGFSIIDLRIFKSFVLRKLGQNLIKTRVELPLDLGTNG